MKKGKKWLVAGLLAGSLFGLSSTGFAAFWNVTGDTGVHDPSIIKEGNSWYTFSTGQGIQVLKSDNGTQWYRVPQIFLTPPSWWKTYVPKQTTNDVWAPDIQEYNGRVWLYYSISSFGSNQSAIGLASASSIGAGQWRDDGLVLRTTTSNNYNAIDPNLVIDASGDPWLVFGSYWSGIKLTKIDKNTMKPTGSITSIAARPSNSGAIEGPSMVYRNGYYYLFASIDSCCQGVNSTYKIVYGRSKNITGPFVDKNGVDMLNGGGTILDTGNDKWKGPGGQDIYGTNIIARHAYDAEDNGNPKLLISDLNWDSNGWPKY
ncbi:extracellular endo-alpha-(1-_5)-L-arabinanase 1 [Paenibacillus sp. J45TS6]|uniref:glycoside hydrolase family 43 protein n=1 Tax=unclassified Paenibacillus TaxID=185978 RepID=UPI001B192F04|nr:glycoside hydrolase family 43 protein [Paenibacillus sp. J45TS6]GIP44485.1 extracellular endo-alpha-(1->5)-L-arabinanase 1 [Paenibacillus sp. J45TS6]